MLLACSAKDPEPVPVERPPPVRDLKAKALLEDAAKLPFAGIADGSLGDTDQLRFFYGYASSSPTIYTDMIVETCATYLTDAEPVKRLLAAGCIQSSGQNDPGPLRTTVIARLAEVVEHDPKIEIRRVAAGALRHVGHGNDQGLGDPAIIARMLALVPTADEREPALAADLLESMLAKSLPASVQTFALATIAAGSASTELTASAYDALAFMPKGTACSAIAKALPAKEAFFAVRQVASGDCDTLVDPAIDRGIDLSRDASNLLLWDNFTEHRKLSSAQRARIRAGLARFAVKDPGFSRGYLEMFR